MPTCDTCGVEFAETAILECPDCGNEHCRDHYHGHDCDPEESNEGSTLADSEDGHQNGESSMPASAQLGYLITGLAAIVGIIHLAWTLDPLIFGARGLETIAPVFRLVVVAAMFAFGTFVMVATRFFADDRGTGRE